MNTTQRRSTSHSSSLLLLELIFAIFFFLIACVICVQLFLNARLLSKNAQALSYGVTQCSNAAQIILAADSVTEMEQLLQKAFPEMILPSDSSVSVPSRNLSSPCETFISWQVQNNLLTAVICFRETSDSDPIYELTLDHYLPEEPYAQ